MLSRITITFTQEEREGLQQIAGSDFRPPKDELRWLLREELKRRQLIPRCDKSDGNAPERMAVSAA